MSLETLEVPTVSQIDKNAGRFELIESVELAKRWRVPPSWVRNHTRKRTPKEHRIPCLRLGRYVRFEWASPQLDAWLAKHRDGQ